ncbi:MAG: acetyl-CoA C-acetyltransferase [Gammaproteobacteria bacterium]|nr:acetyl-CoA C-acetyltransferase [Gammaproteobacteria bacterium]MCP4475648.1 acetyl-CoA C-acetyltransferase [Gammaproteobacteria bacterium]
MNGRPVYIIDGKRTPFLKAKGVGPFFATDLATHAAKAVLKRMPFSPEVIDEVIIGRAMPGKDEFNTGRIVAQRAGCGRDTPGWMVQRNCGSGMQALDCGYKNIASGRSELVLAGGTDAMSHAPLLYSDRALKWFVAMALKRGKWWKPPLKEFFRPWPVLKHGLTDPLTGVNMGQTAEILAHKFAISREHSDEFANRSHQRTAAAVDSDYLAEIATMYDFSGTVYDSDSGLRRDSSAEKLAKLRPFFDKKYGQVTAGNSSQVTDGACCLILASEEAIKAHQLTPLAEIKGANWGACDARQMGLGPVHATTPLLQRLNLGRDDIDYWEINEAFAVQVLACLAAWQDKTYCRDHFAMDEPFGEIDQQRLNIDGGAIALGHPLGASGARIVLHLVDILQRKQAKRGVATICIGGGQGGAMVIERVD